MWYFKSIYQIFDILIVDIRSFPDLSDFNPHLPITFQNCRDNTAGPRCNICASGYYGEPMNGIPCRPCKCPTAERNYAGYKIDNIYLLN